MSACVSVTSSSCFDSCRGAARPGFARSLAGYLFDDSAPPDNFCPLADYL
jgi:hypothetical protein